MASFDSSGWPSGATVTVYARDAFGSQTGSSITSAVATAQGVASFSGLADSGKFVATDGSRTVRFGTPPGASVSSARPVWVDQHRIDYLAGVHPAPPTAVLGGGTSGIASSRSIQSDLGADPFVAFGARVATQVAFPPFFTALNNDGTAENVAFFGMARNFYGDDIELRTWGHGNAYQVYVDGMPISAGINPGGVVASDGADHLLRLTFASVALRRLTIVSQANGWLRDVRIKPTHAIAAPHVPLGPRIGWIGDSFIEGTGALAGFTGHAPSAGRLVGTLDTVASGSGGTGYLNPGVGGRVKFRDRVQKDLLDRGPFEVACVWGGMNDQSFIDAAGATVAQTGTEAKALYQQIINSGQVPSAKRLVVFGPYWPGGSPVATLTALNTELKARAAEVGATYVDIQAGQWLTGTGKSTATNGTGNADIFTGPDGTHPTQAGHDYLARHCAGAILTATS